MASLILLIAFGGLDPAEPGPYRVGVTTFDAVDPDRNDRQIRIEVWYPTHATSDLPAPRYSSGVPTQAIREAAPARGPFPWMIFSHGLSAVREQSTFLTEHLASHGYVVISPDHPNNNGRDFKLLEINQSGLDRPMDLRVVLDRVFARSCDPGDLLYGTMGDRGVAAGQSLGGYTAMTLGGALVRGEAAPQTGSVDNRPDYYDFSDPRIDAVIAYVPFYRPAFNPRGLQELRVPTLIVGGTEDIVTPFELNQAPIFQQMTGPRMLALIEGASHFSFNNDEMIERASFLIRQLHKPTIERSKSDAIVRRLTLAFLDRYLLGHDRYASYLSGEQPGVELRTAVGGRSANVTAFPSMQRR